MKRTTPFELAPKGFLVAFPDFPNVHTFGDDEQEALERAVDALESMLMAMIEDRDEIPYPSPLKRGRKSILLPALSEAKLALYRQMRALGVGKAELARRLNCHLPQDRPPARPAPLFPARPA